MNTYDTLISAADLQAAIAEQSNRAQPTRALVILDCRAQLGDPAAGPAAWTSGHIPFAQHANLELDLAAPAHSVPPAGGGRHPLPDPTDFSACCARWGISNRCQVVAYDDAGGAYAARAWWLLRWLGHRAVAVLDGGIQAFQKLPAGELTQTAPAVEPALFEARPSLTRIAALSELEAYVSELPVTQAGSSSEAAPRLSLLDARSPQRFAGEAEPIDPVAGHIPGARCFFHAQNLGPDGLFLPAQQLKSRFESAVTSSAEVVCYCGSGVTAAHNVLALKIAGLPEPKLYVGSWSEWCSDPDRKVTGRGG